MNARTTAVLWGSLVTAVLIIVPLSLRDRLPEPLAVHWGMSGAPDNATSFGAYLAMVLALWVVPWLVMVGVAVRGMGPARRLGRTYWWGSLAFLSVFALGLNGITLLANLDAADWTRAELSGWLVAGIVAVSVAAALAAGYAGRGAPDQPPPPGEQPPRLRMRAGTRAVWVSRVSNPWLAAVTALAGGALLVTIALRLVGLVPGGMSAGLLPVLVVVLVAGLLSTSVTVTAGQDGVAIGFGPFGWPVRRIRLSGIDSAMTETRHPSQVGGWGFRGVPGSATIMLRGGECLIIRYRSGGQLAISIDDAARGASLINALIAERVEK
ncbi:DUF1648 domain-containing protein [Nonomuraea zeae]|uniref:DUF1648 domain-containing protein n=1 Tax=Nonomuraea zeae TaxID=1642303 RepID=A0A5S4F580_9ACTN|nr:DUF1648 domain-containing protein [Nonomuraea zeae]TMR11363.1 DUF1648 domain-containing protein [Nonomuraea zeae]